MDNQEICSRCKVTYLWEDNILAPVVITCGCSFCLRCVRILENQPEPKCINCQYRYILNHSVINEQIRKNLRDKVYKIQAEIVNSTGGRVRGIANDGGLLYSYDPNNRCLQSFGRSFYIETNIHLKHYDHRMRRTIYKLLDVACCDQKLELITKSIFSRNRQTYSGEKFKSLSRLVTRIKDHDHNNISLTALLGILQLYKFHSLEQVIVSTIYESDNFDDLLKEQYPRIREKLDVPISALLSSKSSDSRELIVNVVEQLNLKTELCYLLYQASDGDDTLLHKLEEDSNNPRTCNSQFLLDLMHKNGIKLRIPVEAFYYSGNHLLLKRFEQWAGCQTDVNVLKRPAGFTPVEQDKRNKTASTGESVSTVENNQLPTSEQ